jgi:hypothetical protein
MYSAEKMPPDGFGLSQPQLVQWQFIISAIQAGVGVLSLGALFYYVCKTAKIAEQTQKAAEATRDAAQAAQAQLGELAEARLASVRPYVHFERAGADSLNPQAGNTTFQIYVWIRNAGSGPALSVHGELQGPHIRSNRSWDKLMLLPGAVKDQWHIAQVEILREHRGRGTESDWTLRLEYRDLYGRHWMSGVTLRASTGPGTQLRVDVREHTFVVRSIHRFEIPLDKLGVDETAGA